MSTRPTKLWAAITTGGYVLYTVEARDGITARAMVQSARKRSDVIETVRLLRPDDMGMMGAEVPSPIFRA